jgi:4-amino-4-deoxy-L-arabinose transferase-like glycosyltransferase
MGAPICTRPAAEVHSAVLRWALVSALAFAVYLQGSSVPFSNTAESQEALVVWEMVDSGDWILPRVNGELIPSKPPLYHWLAIGFTAFTGTVDELAARLPSITAAALALGVVYAAAAAEWGGAAAVISAVVLGTSPEWVKWATTARTDSTFTLFVTVALLLGHRWLRSGRSATLLWLAAAGGAATLAKGFAGPGLVGIVVAVELWRQRAWSVVRLRPLVLAAALFLALACGWYAAAAAKEGFAFFHKQIVLENVLRFLPNEEGGPSRKHSPLFYAPILLAGMLPWSLALPHALLRGYRERANGARAGGAFSGYLLTWFVVVFAVCSAASGKRSNYLLPLYPAAALLVGRDLSMLLRAPDSAARTRVLSVAGAAAAALTAAAAAVLLCWRLGLAPWAAVIPWLHPKDRLLLPRMIALVGRPDLWVLVLAASWAVALVVATVCRAWRGLYGLVGSALVLVTLLGCRIVPGLESSLRSFAPFSRRAAAAVGEEPLCFFQAPDLAVLFYLRRHVPVERGPFGAIRRPSYVLAWEKDWQRLSTADRGHATVIDTSPPASAGRPDSRLLLLRLARGEG